MRKGQSGISWLVLLEAAATVELTGLAFAFVSDLENSSWLSRLYQAQTTAPHSCNVSVAEPMTDFSGFDR
jgi:hypothetical protein